MPELIDKNALQEALREEYDRHKALYDEIGHIERGGIVQGLSYAKMILCKQPTIPDINRAVILRLCNEIEDVACDIGNQTMNDIVYAEAQMIFDKVKAIVKEMTGDETERTD